MSGLSGLEPAEAAKACVHLYVGNGKGKTTAAAGLCVRAVGAGKRVLFCQFLKGRDSHELKGLEKLGAEIVRAKCSTKFLFQIDGDERAQLAADHADCLCGVTQRIMASDFDLVVLDEVIDALNAGLVKREDLATLIARRPAHVELVLTGRNPPPELCETADYHTEFVCKKHPFDCGVPAREGIEY